MIENLSKKISKEEEKNEEDLLHLMEMNKKKLKHFIPFFNSFHLFAVSLFEIHKKNIGFFVSVEVVAGEYTQINF